MEDGRAERLIERQADDQDDDDDDQEDGGYDHGEDDDDDDQGSREAVEAGWLIGRRGNGSEHPRSRSDSL